MKRSQKYPTIAFVICIMLFYFSGAPLERGWPLFCWGFVIVLAALFALAIGVGADSEEDKNQEEEK